MKISKDETEHFDAGGFRGNLYVDKKDNPAFNVLLIECVSRRFKTKIKAATRVYFVIEGSGSFVIDEKRMEARPNDLFIVSSGETFEYEGSMRLFEFNIPATGSENEERLE